MLDALARDLAAARYARGPLAPLTLVTAGAAYAAHVRQGLASRLGVFANTPIRSLRGLLADLGRSHDPEFELLDGQSLTSHLVEMLHQEEVLERPELSPVRAYLQASDADAEDDRRVQLAQTLGPLFEAYILYRPDWVTAWLKGQGKSDAWQVALFQELASRGAGRTLLQSLEVLDRAALPSHLFIFETPLRSPLLAEAVSMLSRRSEVVVYATTPCLEYWEDLSAGPQLSLLDAPRSTSEDPAPLRLWGRPSQEEMKILATLTDYHVDQLSDEPKMSPTTALSAMQVDVLQRRPPRKPLPTYKRSAVHSIEVVQASGIRRECEAVAGEVWRLIDADPDLRWTDIVIALPSTGDADAYRSQLAAAFAEAGSIPFHELNVPLAVESSVVDAVRLLLQLPASAFTRQDILRILTHPSVRARFQLGDTDAWLAWCDRLSIVHGADHGDHADTYIEKDLFNWDQGLRRLALGAFMAAEGLGRSEPVTLGNTELFPTDFSSDEVASAGRFIALARSLIEDAKSIQQAKLQLNEWPSYIRLYIDTYVGAAHEEDERDLDRVLGALEGLAGFGPVSTPVRFRSAAALALDTIESLRAHRGQPLAESVVVAPLTEVASLPFKVTFIPGLGEGKFPASDRPSSLDLRTGSRRAGEFSPRELDERAFLLRILSTTDVLRLSYVATDATTGDALPPSSTLAQLIGLLEEGYVGAGGIPQRTEPAHRHEKPSRSERALAEQEAVEMGIAVRAALPSGAHLSDFSALAVALANPIWQTLSRKLGIHLPPPSTASEAKPRVRLSYLQRFLEDPRQGWARQVLGLSERDLAQNPLARTEEHFEMDRGPGVELLREVFLSWLDSGGEPSSLEHRYRSEANALELKGELPTGVFGDATRRRHLQTLEAWRVRYLEAVEGQRARLFRLELGLANGADGLSPLSPPEASAQRYKALPGLELENGTLVGLSEPVLQEGGCILFVDRILAPSSPERFRQFMKAWLTYLAWSASGLPSPPKWTISVADRGDRLHREVLRSVGATEARAYLDKLVSDLVCQDHAYRLPLSAQLRLHDARTKGQSAKRLRTILERSRQDPFGPLRDNETDRIPDVEEALALIDRRLGPLLDALGRGPSS